MLPWFDANFRDLPWRANNDPYPVWISEIMLQQTQVATVVPYFERWMTAFPTVKALAGASEAEVLKRWEGLGYYRRVRMIHAAARTILESGFPSSYAGWLNVAGVGEYTAAAISSIAFSEVQAVVDGNVKRVFARYTSSELVGPALHKAAHVWATRCIDHARPGDWNQAVMELGATICTPTSPDCNRCPVSVGCSTARDATQHLFPAKREKAPPLQLEESILVLRCGDEIAFTTAHLRGWWKGLLLLPNGEPPAGATLLGSFKYTVTNHRVSARVYASECTTRSEEYEWIAISSIHKISMPAPHRRALGFLTKLER